MRKRVQVALAVLLVAIVGVIAWQVLGDREPEPVYQGKALREWLRQYRLVLSAGDEERVQARNMAEGAVRHIGTNAIPSLLKMLGKKDSSIVAKMVGLWNRHYYSIPVWARHPGWYRNQAAFLNENAALGFKILAADAQQAVPALIRLYEQNISVHSQAATSRALIAIGPAAQRMAIPSFLRGAGSSNAPVREVAVWALSEIDTEPRLVVPRLVNALNDTNFVIRMVAAGGLGRLGTNSQRAVPALLLLLSDPSLDVRPEVTNALKAIDPEAAARVGVK
jgi:HEAT repeat protein